MGRALAAAAVVVCAACGRIGFGDIGNGDGGRGGDASDGRTADAAPALPVVAVGVWPAAGAQLTRTLATSTSRTTFTFATWYFSSSTSTILFGAGAAVPRNTNITSGAEVAQQFSANVYGAAPNLGGQPWPYTGTWVHIVIAVDTSQAAPEQRTRIWFDGVEFPTLAATTSYFPQGQTTDFGDVVLHTLGSKYDGTYGWTGSLAETYVIWGHALDASAFVETLSPGVVRSIAYTGPVETESVYFDYQVIGHNGFAGQPDWTALAVTSSATNLPY